MLSALNSIVHRVQQLADVDPALRDVLAALEPAQVQAEEAAHSLTRYVDRLELDPERLEAVSERMQALHATGRKFRLPPEQLADELVARRQQLDDLQSAQDINKVLAREAASKAAYLTLAQHLSLARKQAAQALSAAVTEAMQGLSMAGGSFVAALNPLDEGQSYGLEQVEFLVAGHAGVSARPLARVASGGELARISLAISVITSEASPTPTLIFDEVDTGIGGAVAEVVGRRCRNSGARAGPVRDAPAAGRRAGRASSAGQQGDHRRRVRLHHALAHPRARRRRSRWWRPRACSAARR